MKKIEDFLHVHDFEEYIKTSNFPPMFKKQLIALINDKNFDKEKFKQYLKKQANYLNNKGV